MTKTVLILISSLLLCGVCPAQVPPSTPPAGHPEILFVFMDFHQSLLQQLQTDSKWLPAVLHKYNMDAADFVKIAPILNSTKTELDNLHAEALRYKAAFRLPGTTSAPDYKVLLQFHTRRQQILLSGIARLQSNLSPSAWKGLDAYMNGEIRRSIHVWPTQ